MRILRYLFILTLALCSCVDEPVGLSPQDTPVSFSPTIQYEGSNLRLAGNEWEHNDAVGIYMLPGDDADNNPLHANIKYSISRDPNGDVTLLPTNQTLFFPKSKEDVRFTAYYPFRENVPNNIYSVDVSTAAGQSQTLSDVDLVYSRSNGKYSSSNPSVPLVFRHKLSKIVVYVESVTGGSDISGMQVSLDGFPTKADFNLVTGDVNNVQVETNASVTLHKPITYANNVKFEAIIVPHETGDFNGRTIRFSVGGQEYTFDVQSDARFTFSSGVVNSYYFTLDSQGVTLAENTIVDWVDGTMAWNGGQLTIDRNEFNLGGQSATKSVQLSTLSVSGNITITAADVKAYSTLPNQPATPISWINNFQVVETGSSEDNSIKNYTLSFSVDEYTGDSGRTGYIHVKVANIVLVITVVQHYMHVTPPIPKNFVVDAGPDTREYYFTFETEYPGYLTRKSVTASNGSGIFIIADDITVSTSPEGDIYRHTVSFRVPENSFQSSRTNVIQIVVKKNISDSELAQFIFSSTVTQTGRVPFYNGEDGEGFVDPSQNTFIVQPRSTIRIREQYAIDKARERWGGDPWISWVEVYLRNWNDQDNSTWIDRNNGVITVNAGINPENVVILVHGGGGSGGGVLWSWHIWVTDYNPDLEGASWNAPNGYVFMDRNIGAFSGTIGTQNVGDTYGMYYQWGRKDMFPSMHVGVGTDSGTRDSNHAHSNPTRFITASGNNDDWLSPSDANRWIGNNGQKTENDPCPRGWRVPTMMQGGASPWAGLNQNNGKYVEGKGYIWEYNNRVSFYPSAGFRNNWSAQVNEAGTHGSYWVANAAGDGMAYDLSFTSHDLNNVGAWHRSMGYSVRCMKDTN